VNDDKRDFEIARIMLQRLPNGEPELVLHGAYLARFLETGTNIGHLVFISRGTLFAVPFDLDSLKVCGKQVPLVSEVVAQNGDEQSAAHFDLSADGTLVYVKGVFQKEFLEFYWIKPDGTLDNLGLSPSEYGFWFQLSPDGQSLAYYRWDDGNWNIWVFDIERKTPMQLTFDTGNDVFPVWNPTGTHIAFASDRKDGNRAIYSVRKDGGQEKLLFTSTNALGPWDWHPSEPYLAISEWIPGAGLGLNILPLEGNDQTGWKGTTATNFIQAEFGPMDAAFSPDGKWIAYSSEESKSDGRQVFVQQFPGGGRKKRISNLEGSVDGPVWHIGDSGQELIFLSGKDKTYPLFRTAISIRDGNLVHDPPAAWEGMVIEKSEWGRNYDVHPDGKVLWLKPIGDEAKKRFDHVVVFENFAEYLRQNVPIEDK
jgi:hypothetical protein